LISSEVTPWIPAQSTWLTVSTSVFFNRPASAHSRTALRNVSNASRPLELSKSVSECSGSGEINTSSYSLGCASPNRIYSLRPSRSFSIGSFDDSEILLTLAASCLKVRSQIWCSRSPLSSKYR